jgi:hypothetical protein
VPHFIPRRLDQSPVVWWTARSSADPRSGRLANLAKNSDARVLRAALRRLDAKASAAGVRRRAQARSGHAAELVPAATKRELPPIIGKYMRA